MRNSLLARFAENIFWLARYMERAENLARIIDVTGTHGGDEHGIKNWRALLEMNADLDCFRALSGDMTPRAVVYFYLLDRQNPTSITSAVTHARENARSLRHLISTEMWSQINVFHGWITDLDRRDITDKRVSGVCTRIKEACQTHTGITEGTLYQDQGWSYYWMGKAVERADQTSRLIDVGFRQARVFGKDQAAGELDSHWNALLRSASGYQAFRRTYRIRMRSHEVLTFLMLDGDFPRSLLSSVESVQYNMRRLETRFGLDTGREASAVLDDLRAHLIGTDVPTILAGGLHDYVDDIQRRLIDFSNTLDRGCFGHLV